MQALGDSIAALVSSVLTLLIVTTLMLMVTRRFMPFIGQPLWQLYQRGLWWCVVAPFRLLRVLIRAATDHRR